MISVALVQDLIARLELHLGQVCDPAKCETPEHSETAALIERAREVVSRHGNRA